MAYYPPTDWELKDFFREHADALYRSCCFLTCGQGDAQKMTEDIFLSLLKRGMIFSSDKDGRAWMILMAYKMSRKPPKPVLIEQEIPAEQPAEEAEAANIDTAAQVCIPEKMEKCQNLQVEPAAAEDTELQPDSAGKDISADAQMFVADEGSESAESREEKATVSVPLFPEELRKLSRKDRLIALMYYCEGYRKAEIANYLGWPTFRVSSRLMRIKKRILPEKGTVEAC